MKGVEAHRGGKSRSRAFRVLQALLRTIGVIALLIVAFLIYAAIPRTDTFYIKGADLADRAFLANLQAKLAIANSGERFELRHKSPTVYAHRIGPGNNLVLAYRWWTPGSLLLIDDEGFEKITISVPETEKIGKNTYPLGSDEQNIALVTEGGSAWPATACTWRISDGSVMVETSASTYRVHAVGSLVLAVSNDAADYCRAKTHFDKTFEARRMELAALTTWLGKAGAHPYNETYR